MGDIFREHQSVHIGNVEPLADRILDRNVSDLAASCFANTDTSGWNVAVFRRLIVGSKRCTLRIRSNNSKIGKYLVLNVSPREQPIAILAGESQGRGRLNRAASNDDGLCAPIFVRWNFFSSIPSPS